MDRYNIPGRNPGNEVLPVKYANHEDGTVARSTPDELIRVMGQDHGLDISGFDPAFLLRSLERRVQAIGCGSTEFYLAGQLHGNPAEAEALYRSLRVGYSMFFRDPLTFALLESQVLPDLAERAKKSGHSGLRVWSAGCSAGQEAWSLAILLDALAALPERQLSWRVFGTDLSEQDLGLAREGVYTAAELGNVRLRHLDACFSLQGDAFAVVPRLRDHVEFSVYDLLDGANSCPPSSIFGDFDLVLCCNVLLYYRPEQQRRILDTLLGCLRPGGYLVTGETERRIATSSADLRELIASAPISQTSRR